MVRFNIQPKSVLYGIVCAAVLVGVYIVGGKVGEPYSTNTPNNQSIATSQPYSNLDLRVAGTGIYQNGAFKVTKKLDPDHHVDRSIISFAVPADNLTEYGLMTTPQGTAPSGGWPVIILVHGFIVPAAYSTKNAYLPDMEFYSQHGFAVIKPDLRGQGLSIKAGKPEGAYYSMAYNTDILSLIAAIKQTPGYNSSNLNLWGHSMGAYIALRAAVLSPDVRNVILLAGPVGYVQDMYSDFSPRSDKANPVAYSIRKKALAAYGTPLNNPTFWNYTSPLDFLSNSHAYIQINVGAKDKVVPPKFSADLNTALNAAQVPHAYVVYPNGDHGMLSVRPQIYKSSLQVLQRQ